MSVGPWGVGLIPQVVQVRVVAWVGTASGFELSNGHAGHLRLASDDTSLTWTNSLVVHVPIVSSTQDSHSRPPVRKEP